MCDRITEKLRQKDIKPDSAKYTIAENELINSEQFWNENYPQRAATFDIMFRYTFEEYIKVQKGVDPIVVWKPDLLHFVQCVHGCVYAYAQVCVHMCVVYRLRI